MAREDVDTEDGLLSSGGASCQGRYQGTMATHIGGVQTATVRTEKANNERGQKSTKQSTSENWGCEGHTDFFFLVRVPLGLELIAAKGSS